jgi:hypothetical protein
VFLPAARASFIDLLRTAIGDGLDDLKHSEVIRLVGAVGIELKATLKTRKLLILLNVKNAKNSQYAEVRYTAGTRTGTNRALDSPIHRPTPLPVLKHCLSSDSCPDIVQYSWHDERLSSPSEPHF